MTKLALVAISALALAAGVLACASSPPGAPTTSDIVVPKLDAASAVADTGPPPPTYSNDASGRYAEAVDLMKQQRWDEAAAAFSNVRATFAYSRYAPLSELRLADIALAQKDYPTAAQLYEQWAHDHPGNENASMVLMRARWVRCQLKGSAICAVDTYDAGF